MGSWVKYLAVTGRWLGIAPSLFSVLYLYCDEFVSGLQFCTFSEHYKWSGSLFCILLPLHFLHYKHKSSLEPVWIQWDSKLTGDLGPNLEQVLFPTKRPHEQACVQLSFYLDMLYHKVALISKKRKLPPNGQLPSGYLSVLLIDDLHVG